MNEHVDRIKRKCMQYLGDPLSNHITDEKIKELLNFILYECQDIDDDIEKLEKG